MSTYAGPPPVKPSRPRRWPWILGMAGTFALGLMAGAAGDGSQTASEAPPEPAVTVTVPAPAKTVTAAPGARETAQGSEPGKSFPGEGTYLVGKDIEPGTYRSRPVEDAVPNCYWARLMSAEGAPTDIIANDNAQGQTTVTIKESDAAFQTKGCQVWERVD